MFLYLLGGFCRLSISPTFCLSLIIFIWGKLTFLITISCSTGVIATKTPFFQSWEYQITNMSVWVLISQVPLYLWLYTPNLCWNIRGFVSDEIFLNCGWYCIELNLCRGANFQECFWIFIYFQPVLWCFLPKSMHFFRKSFPF